MPTFISFAVPLSFLPAGLTSDIAPVDLFIGMATADAAATLYVSDLAGRLRAALAYAPGVSRAEMPALPRGTYVARLHGAGGVATQRLVVR